MAHREIRRDLARLALALAKALRSRPPRARLRTFTGRRIIADGLEHGFWTDFYHNAMTVSWPAFFAVLAGAFVALNVVFAGLYSTSERIRSPTRGSATSTTCSSSASRRARPSATATCTRRRCTRTSVATVEGFVAIVLIALMTGLTFARFSRPRARLIFARNPVVADHDGTPTLIFRLANARNAFISEATAKLWMLSGTATREGRRFVGFKPLRLIKNENPVLALSWTLFHPIDGESPLFGWTMDELPDERDELHSQHRRFRRDLGADRTRAPDLRRPGPAARPRIRRHPQHRRQTASAISTMPASTTRVRFVGSRRSRWNPQTPSYPTSPKATRSIFRVADGAGGRLKWRRSPARPGPTPRPTPPIAPPGARCSTNSPSAGPPPRRAARPRRASVMSRAASSPARDRVARLIDPGSPFLEIGALAAFGMYEGDVHGAGMVAGIGRIEGREAMIVANDPTIKGGAYYPMTVKKHLRAQEIADENRLPCVYLVDSGGANLPHQAEVFPDREHFGRIFYNQARMSAEGIAPDRGGDGLLHRRRRLCAGDGRRDDHRRGPGDDLPRRSAAGQSRDRRDRLGRGARRRRSAHARLRRRRSRWRATTHRRWRWRAAPSPISTVRRSAARGVVAAREPLYPAEELEAIAPVDLRKQYDVRELIARLVDGSEFDEFKARYGTTLVTGFARLSGMLIGIVANNGVLFSESALKGRAFRRAVRATRRSRCCSCRTSRASWSGGNTRPAASPRTARNW